MKAVWLLVGLASLVLANHTPAEDHEPEGHDQCEAEGLPEECGHPSLTVLGGCIHMESAAIYILFLIVIMFSVAVELVLHRLDHWAEHKKHFLPVINMLYREVMLMGLISFLLFISVTMRWCQFRKHEIEFEFAHYYVFFVSVFYIAIVVFMLILVQILYTRFEDWQWRAPEAAESHYRQLKAEVRAIPWYMRWLSPHLMYRYYHMQRLHHFVLLRSAFLLLNYNAIDAAAARAHRKAGQERFSTKKTLVSFDFVRYIRKSTRNMLHKLLKIGAPITSILVLFMVVQIIRLSIHGGSVSLEYKGFIFFGYVITFPFFFVLYGGLRLRIAQFNTTIAKSGVDIIPFHPLDRSNQPQKDHGRLLSVVRPSAALSVQDPLDVQKEPAMLNHLDGDSLARLAAKLGDLSPWKYLSSQTYFYLLQVLIYWQAFYMSGLILYVYNSIQKSEETHRTKIGYHILAWLPPVLVFSVQLPVILPKYIMLLCMGKLDTEALSHCYKGKYPKTLKKRAASLANIRAQNEIPIMNQTIPEEKIESDSDESME